MNKVVVRLKIIVSQYKKANSSLTQTENMWVFSLIDKTKRRVEEEAVTEGLA